ncbi:MAG TPA: GSU2403 family nucleotidyltransferase fold protein, partial [Planctomycetota bacterium]|nr:GSU2403 family nucleotidyltransferase fold protein [Planctomycetota bacterium]
NPSRRDPHVEFITQQRQPASDSNAHPQRDQLIAYTLDYVGLLLEAPVQVDVPRLGMVQLPHPLAYALQKVLIRPERQRNRQNVAKDSADAFKIVASFRAAWIKWRPEFRHWSDHPQYGAWIRQAQNLWSQLYDRIADRGAQEVNAAYPNYDVAAIVTIMRDLRDVLAPPT